MQVVETPKRYLSLKSDLVLRLNPDKIIRIIRLFGEWNQFLQFVMTILRFQTATTNSICMTCPILARSYHHAKKRKAFMRIAEVKGLNPIQALPSCVYNYNVLLSYKAWQWCLKNLTFSHIITSVIPWWQVPDRRADTNPIPTWFPKDMRYMTTETGQQHFTVNKFLCAQQIQRYFSCNAAKLRHTTAFQSGAKVTKAIYRWLGTKNHIHMPVLLS